MSGGQGTIFTAKYKGIDVIAKVMEIKDNEEQKANRIKKREVNLMSKFEECKYIARFYGWIQETEGIWLMVENLKGQDIKQYIAPTFKLRLNIKQKVKILLDTAEGLVFLHGKNIMHRDIKSANVGIDKEITEGSLDFTAKIFDFGVSKEENSKAAATHVSGTIKYNAPEQKNDSYTTQVDIYAFACMAFELFSEKVCYTDSKTKNINDTQLTNFVRTKDLRPDSHQKPKDDTPKEMISMYKQCWDKDPSKRMTAVELRDYLKNFYDTL